jgi:hypothetical protein
MFFELTFQRHFNKSKYVSISNPLLKWNKNSKHAHKPINFKCIFKKVEGFVIFQWTCGTMILYNSIMSLIKTISITNLGIELITTLFNKNTWKDYTSLQPINKLFHFHFKNYIKTNAYKLPNYNNFGD